MKKLRFLAVAVAFGIGGAVRADDGPSIPRGSLGSGANLGQFLGGLGAPGASGNSPFTSGLGQTVSGWTHQGIHGPELAERIHWLQGMRAEEIAERTRSLEQRRFGRDDRFRDIREDRRELRNDEHRLREDQRRLGRDREDLRHDLRDRNNRFRDRDIREDRRELGNDEHRLREDQRRVDRDRQDLQRDVRDRDRDDRFPDRDRDRNRDDRSRDRDEHGMRDHDPRRDRDNSARKDRDVQGSHDRGHDHSLNRKEDFGKHLGAQGGKRDNHPALNDMKKGDTQKHIPNFKNDHRLNVPSPKNSKNPVQFGKSKGKGK